MAIIFPSVSCGRDAAETISFAQLPGAEPDHDAHSASPFERVNARTSFTQPKVLHGMSIHRLIHVRMMLVKAEESPLPIVKMDFAVWIRAFRNHEPSWWQIPSLAKHSVLKRRLLLERRLTGPVLVAPPISTHV